MTNENEKPNSRGGRLIVGIVVAFLHLIYLLLLGLFHICSFSYYPGLRHKSSHPWHYGSYYCPYPGLVVKNIRRYSIQGAQGSSSLLLADLLHKN